MMSLSKVLKFLCTMKGQPHPPKPGSVWFPLCVLAAVWTLEALTCKPCLNFSFPLKRDLLTSVPSLQLSFLKKKIEHLLFILY